MHPPGPLPSVALTHRALTAALIMRRPMLSTSSAATPSSTRSRLGASETNETKLFVGATRAVPAWHHAGERVAAEAHLASHDLGMRGQALFACACRSSDGRALHCIRVCCRFWLALQCSSLHLVRYADVCREPECVVRLGQVWAAQQWSVSTLRPARCRARLASYRSRIRKVERPSGSFF